MRFNNKELFTLATQPSNKFEKEGILFVTEKQEGFFRRSEGAGSKETNSKVRLACIVGTAKVSLERWCRLRGNLLFYFKTTDQFSEPQGVIVLEKCKPISFNDRKEHDGYVFFIEFEDGLKQRLAATTETERNDWVLAIQTAGYSAMRKQMELLQQRIIELRISRGIDAPTDINIKQIEAGSKDIDITEPPISESSIACDNLLCDSHGRPPNPSVIIYIIGGHRGGWVQYARTEVIERCSNPQFLSTVAFRSYDGLTNDSTIRFTVYDVREKVSQTMVPVGTAEIQLKVIKETSRLRIPIQSTLASNVGFITLSSWAPEKDKEFLRSPAKVVTGGASVYNMGHRRSQSLPPKLGVKLYVPCHEKLALLFANPNIHTFRFHSGLGGDISVQELMMESQLCFVIPQQLLGIWILREKELLQEISGMGELGGTWQQKQMDLLDKHLKLLKHYSQAKQNLQQCTYKYFRTSLCKADEALEFAPINLHLQRMSVHNDTLKKSGIFDVITVGAFTRHSGKSKTGGLIKLLQQTKDSPSKIDQNGIKVQTANDAVQAIKQLRKDIADIMSQLLCLAKAKQPKGMLLLCNEMVTKTRTLLSIWEPSLVDDAFRFIENHRILKNSDSSPLTPLSPFRKITQQLDALDLKSPELEDFATPIGTAPNVWSTKQQLPSIERKRFPSTSDINAIATIQNIVDTYSCKTNNQPFLSLPPIGASSVNDDHNCLKFNETHFNVNGDVSTNDQTDKCDDSLAYEFDENGEPIIQNCSIKLEHNGAFLDTKFMMLSPSANYYRPTEEPEPLDLTQLNIEASVMCLVSKVKFFCGRCGSPAVRLRQPKLQIKRGFTSLSGDIVTPQSPDTIRRNSVPNNSDSNSSKKAQVKGLNLPLQLTDPAKKGNRFTDGLNLTQTTDWASELRPSMRKLRQAMDGLLKTARLMHSVQRLQQDMKKTKTMLDVMYRRDVCFSQALTSLVASLMARFWGSTITENYVQILFNLGPLAYFEGLLSLYGLEMDMWGDMCVAIEDLCAVRFTLIRSNLNRDNKTIPMPRVVGSRQAITILLPVPETVYGLLPTKEMTTFKVTPVFFNIGINEKATLSETLGYSREQHRSNWDNFDRLKQYHIRYKKITLNQSPKKSEINVPTQTVTDLLYEMEKSLRVNSFKNYSILHMAEDICLAVHGLRLTSCKSAKDRTGMAVTLEQCKILHKEFHLPANDLQNVLNTMRSVGTRLDNTYKNIGLRKYAFGLQQVLSLPQIYRPPIGSYGKAKT